MPQLLSRTSAATLFDDLAVLWQSLCDESDAANEEIDRCMHEIQAKGGSDAEMSARLTEARARGKKVRQDMLTFLDLLERGGEH